MELKKFTILNVSNSHQAQEEVDIILNLSHIVSIKPIKMTTTDMRVIEGYWIRLTNGKKYKAVNIPDVIQEIFNENLPSTKYVDADAYVDSDAYTEGLH